MADTKLTDLTDAGRVASGDTGDVIYIVSDAGNSRQAKLGSLVTLSAADTGRLVSNIPADILEEATDTGVLYKLFESTTPITAGDTGDFFIVLDASDGESPKQIHSKYVSPIGQQTIWVPAAAMTPTTTNGCAPLAVEEQATNDVMLSYLAFDDTTSESAQFSIQLPKGWDAGTLVLQAVWAAETATSGAAQWRARAVCIGDDDASDATWGSYAIIETADTAGNAAKDVMITTDSAVLTVANAAAEELCMFWVQRNGAAGGDDMTGDAWLLGVKVHYTVNAGNDN